MKVLKAKRISFCNSFKNVYDKNGNISEKKVDSLVDLYMKAVKAGKEAGGSDPFWNKSYQSLITALIYYVLENDDIPKESKNFSTILQKIQKATAEEDCPLMQEIYTWSDKVENMKLNYARIYYDTFSIAPQKTEKAVLSAMAVDLQTVIKKGEVL